MGVRSVCQYGYPISVCRCTATHDPVGVVPCPANHAHNNLYTGSGPGKVAKDAVEKELGNRVEEREEWQLVWEDGSTTEPMTKKEAARLYAEKMDVEDVIGLRKRRIRVVTFDWQTVL